MRLNTGTRVGDLVDVSAARGGGTAGRGERAGTFQSDLRLLRRRVVGRWALAVAVRCAIAALAVAVVPALLAAFGTIAWAWAIVVPGALFLVALFVRLSRPPSTAEVARLLDERLRLHDVISTAVQLERTGAPHDEGPPARVRAEAAALVGAGVDSWRPRARAGPRELAVAGGLVVALAAIALVGGAGVGSGPAKVTADALPPGLRHHGAAGPNSVSPPLVPPRARRKAAGGGSGAKRHPYGLYAYGFEGRRDLPRYGGKSGATGVRYAGGRPPGQSGSQFAAPGAAEGNEAREKAEAEATQANARPSSRGERRAGGPPPPQQSLKSLTGGAAPPSGSVSPVPSGSAGSRPSAAGAPAGAPSSSASPGARSAGESPSGQAGGSPSGSRSAGTQRAAIGGGEKGAEGGSTTGELALRAGFAAVRSGKAATGHGPRNAQGAGGPGRSAGVGGAAFEEAEAGSLGYVPPDPGVAPSADPGLLARYLDALTAIAGRSW